VWKFGLNVYPNPFTDHIYFELQLMTDSKVLLEIYDISGSNIAAVYNDMVVAYDHYRFEYVPENLYRGTLNYRHIIDGQQMFSGKLDVNNSNTDFRNNRNGFFIA